MPQISFNMFTPTKGLDEAQADSGIATLAQPEEVKMIEFNLYSPKSQTETGDVEKSGLIADQLLPQTVKGMSKDTADPREIMLFQN
mmetsp:Transcript_8334/g.13947  ORF Transcript_8334/g.13947 Transcript_8334/m.13947 type:complete len:86 (+) Transcript_8334:960-1217(+)